MLKLVISGKGGINFHIASVKGQNLFSETLNPFQNIPRQVRVPYLSGYKTGFLSL